MGIGIWERGKKARIKKNQFGVTENKKWYEKGVWKFFSAVIVPVVVFLKTIFIR